MLPGAFLDRISLRVVPVSYSPLWDSYFEIVYLNIIKRTQYKVEERVVVCIIY